MYVEECWGDLSKYQHQNMMHQIDKDQMPMEDFRGEVKQVLTSASDGSVRNRKHKERMSPDKLNIKTLVPQAVNMFYSGMTYTYTLDY